LVKKTTLWLLSLMVSTGGVWAQDPWGIGVMVGEPTGLTFKKWMNERNAWDAAAAVSFSDDTAFEFHADLLTHTSRRTETGEGLPLYLGLGPRVKYDEDDDEEETRVGVRVPVGLNWMARETLELFGEVAPVYDFSVDDDSWDFNAAIGARIYFR
jgi:hypothetical protein